MKRMVDIPKLFAPNAHSVWRIRRLPCEGGNVSRKLVSLYARFFPQDRAAVFRTVERIDEGMNSENYRVEVESALTGTRALIFRRSTARGDRPMLERQSRLQNALATDAPVPSFFPLGEPLQGFVCETEEGCWQCSPFLPGDHFRGTRDELVDAARAAARIHAALRRYPGVAEFPAGSYGTMDRGEWETAMGQLPGTDAEELVRTHQGQLYALLDAAEAFFAAHRGTPLLAEQLIHGDLIPQNFLVRGGKVTAIIDFGNACFGRIGMDVGNTCHRLVRQYVVNAADAGQPWQESLPAGLRVFLDAYREADPGYGREAERALPTFMREILLRKIGFNLQGCLDGRRTLDQAADQVGRFLGLLAEVGEIESRL